MRIKILALALSCALAGVAVGSGGTWYLTRTVATGRIAIGVTAPSAHTVTWYEAHPTEIKAKLAACYDNPGGAIHDPECANADTAQGKLEATQKSLVPAPKPSGQ